jgi:hypothetical protein
MRMATGCEAQRVEATMSRPSEERRTAFAMALSGAGLRTVIASSSEGAGSGLEAKSDASRCEVGLALVALCS